MITLKRLTYEERAVWGVCPVCAVEHGQACVFVHGPDDESLQNGAHVARLVNAPHELAVSEP